MYLAKVMGSVVASEKERNMESRRLFAVRLLNETLAETETVYVCVDSVSARPGDIVLTCGSSSSRLASAAVGTCADSTIVAIVDRISSAKEDRYVR
jgi:carbon dioxide concentrating mechanism protein CcmL